MDTNDSGRVAVRGGTLTTAVFSVVGYEIEGKDVVEERYTIEEDALGLTKRNISSRKRMDYKEYETDEAHYERLQHGSYRNVRLHGRDERGGMHILEDCSICGATVRSYDPPTKTCPTCGGSGEIEDNELGGK